MSSIQAKSPSPFALPSYLSDTVEKHEVKVHYDSTTATFTQTGTDTETSKGSDVKPNVMLYIDDSNSMNSQIAFTDPRVWQAGNAYYALNGGVSTPNPNGCLRYDLKAHGYCYATSWSFLKRNIYELFDTDYTNKKGVTDKFGNMANWGITYMNTHGGIYATHNTETFGVDNIKSSLDRANASGNTPLGGGLAYAVNNLYDKIDYRCQKNYVIAFTDGDANVNVTGYPLGGNAWSKVNRCGFTRLAFATGWPGDQFGFSKLGCINGKDLKDTGTDKAGVSWDDPDYKNQTIEIFSVGYNVSNKSRQALSALASSNLYDSDGNQMQTAYFPTTSKDMRKAFENIFSIIVEQKTENKPSIKPGGNPTITGGNFTSSPSGLGEGVSISNVATYGVVPPSLGSSAKGSLIPSEGATVYNYAGANAAELRFYQFSGAGKTYFDADGKPITSDEILGGLDLDNVGENEDIGVKYTTPSYDNRWVLISNGKDVRWARKGGSNESLDGMFSNGDFDLKDQSGVSGYEWQKALIPWLTRGESDSYINSLGYTENVYTENDDGTKDSAYRERTHKLIRMGNITNSDVVAIGELDANKRNQFLVTSANDGMAYIFESNTTDKDHPYDLKLNYLPTNIPNEQTGDGKVSHVYKEIAHKDYINDEHPLQYTADGGIAAQMMKLYDPYNPGVAKEFTTYMLGNMGRGARGSYALHLKQGTEVFLHDKDKVRLFEFTANDDDALGFTVANSTMGRVSGGVDAGAKPYDKNLHLASFIPSGYAVPSIEGQETALYIYETLGEDAGIEGGKLSRKPGDLLQKVIVHDGKGGLSAPTLLDLNFDGVIDYIFAGDYAGNMYRFDVRDISKKVEVEQIFKADKEFEQPITSAPAIARHNDGNYVIVFGTGSDIYPGDKKSKTQQAIYGIYQKFDVHGTLDVMEDTSNHIKTGGVIKDDLLKQEFVDTNDYFGHKLRYVSNKPMDNALSGGATGDGNNDYSGWMLPLDPSNGERVVVKPSTILHTVYLTSRWYDVKDKDTSTGTYEEFDENKLKEAIAEGKDYNPAGWTLEKGTPSGGSSNKKQCDDTLGLTDDPKDVQEAKDAGWSDWDRELVNTTSSGGSDPCVIETVKDYNVKRTCTKEIGARTDVYTRTSNGESEDYSAIIQLSTHNGGAIYKSKARQLGNGFVNFGGGEFGTYGFAASMQFTGITSFTVTGHNFMNATDLDGNYMASSNTELSGETGPNGVLMDLGDNPPPNPNAFPGCGSSTESHQASIAAQTSRGDSILGKVMGYQIICGVKRISWREIF